MGTYYAASSPDAAPYVRVGDRVEKGQTLCLIEAMKTMNEIPAPCDLLVEEILVDNGALVALTPPSSGTAMFKKILIANRARNRRADFCGPAGKWHRGRHCLLHRRRRFPPCALCEQSVCIGPPRAR